MKAVIPKFSSSDLNLLYNKLVKAFGSPQIYNEIKEREYERLRTVKPLPIGASSIKSRDIDAFKSDIPSFNLLGMMEKGVNLDNVATISSMNGTVTFNNIVDMVEYNMYKDIVATDGKEEGLEDSKEDVSLDQTQIDTERNSEEGYSEATLDMSMLEQMLEDDGSGIVSDEDNLYSDEQDSDYDEEDEINSYLNSVSDEDDDDEDESYDKEDSEDYSEDDEDYNEDDEDYNEDDENEVSDEDGYSSDSVDVSEPKSSPFLFNPNNFFNAPVDADNSQTEEIEENNSQTSYSDVDYIEQTSNSTDDEVQVGYSTEETTNTNSTKHEDYSYEQRQQLADIASKQANQSDKRSEREISFKKADKELVENLNRIKKDDSLSPRQKEQSVKDEIQRHIIFLIRYKVNVTSNDVVSYYKKFKIDNLARKVLKDMLLHNVLVQNNKILRIWRS